MRTSKAARSLFVSLSLFLSPSLPLKTPSTREGGREEKIGVKNKKYINKEIRMLHIRSTDWPRHKSGRSGPQLHSLFSELFYTVQPSDSNECWLWPLVFWVQWKQSVMLSVCERLCLRICMLPLALLFTFLGSLLTWTEQASHGAQSTVDGFYVIHTKLTDSVECSPRQAGQQLWPRDELQEKAGQRRRKDREGQYSGQHDDTGQEQKESNSHKA